MDDVLEPRPLAVRAVAEIAEDLEHGLADLEHLVAIDVAERHGQERERLLGARRGPQAAADQHVVTGDLAVLDDRQEAEVVGVDVGAVVVGEGERRLELPREVRLAVERLDGVVAGGRHQGRPGGGKRSRSSRRRARSPSSSRSEARRGRPSGGRRAGADRGVRRGSAPGSRGRSARRRRTRPGSRASVSLIRRIVAARSSLSTPWSWNSWRVVIRKRAVADRPGQLVAGQELARPSACPPRSGPGP